MTAQPLNAFEWTITELQGVYGRQDIPTFSGGGSQTTSSLTLQHVNDWKYGDTYTFVDFSNSDRTGSDAYGEIYANFSFEKIFGNEIDFGPVSDIGLVAGLNYGREAKVFKYLPGFRVVWDIPGFAFFNTDFTMYIDDNEGVLPGGAPKEDDSYMINISWAFPFEIGGHSFSMEGYLDYIDARRNEFGNKVSSWINSQPQLRYDLGKDMLGKPDRLFVGIEWQYWTNMLGDSDTDQSAVHLLIVGRF